MEEAKAQQNRNFQQGQSPQHPQQAPQQQQQQKPIRPLNQVEPQMRIRMLGKSATQISSGHSRLFKMPVRANRGTDLLQTGSWRAYSHHF
ncbi:hypothetical protein SLEP1_g54606 [Rubroshorea leprosula]|uniref:Uncharacterized protein n=1 Tax=Rubroshorea leprosula TaxID=152421 RepID=A0AAV5MGN5_9ROSI|nr:hypothetical protein SLEP1_g54606 [Rubroshorea leprosula]